MTDAFLNWAGCFLNKRLSADRVFLIYGKPLQGSSQVSRELSDLENTADLMRIVFLYIDRSILQSKLVKDGYDAAIEYVSLMFAGALQDIRMKTKYINFWDSGLEKSS